MKTFQGVLITCQPSVKQIILNLDREFRAKQEGFIYTDLDDTHVFIDPAFVEIVRKKVDELLEDNCYKTSETMNQRDKAKKRSLQSANVTSDEESDY